ncbi:Nuclear factor of kappa light polypeptide protein enhancer in B-cells 1 [Arthrobotrys megalospora]
MPPDTTPETSAKSDANRMLENQRQDARRPLVYHETMVMCAPALQIFDNSVGPLSRDGKTESASLEVSQKLENAGSDIGQKIENLSLDGQRSGGFETGSKTLDLDFTSSRSDFKHETESIFGGGRISHSESAATALVTSNPQNKAEDDEDEAFEFERMAFNFKKAEISFGSGDWSKAEVYLSAVIAMLTSYPKFESRLSGTSRFEILSVFLDCQAKQGKCKEVLRTIEIVLESARTASTLPEDLQSIIGTLEDLRAKAHRQLGDLESARVACKKAVRIRRGDPKRLGGSVKLMVDILGEMGSMEYDVEAEFYRSLISWEAPSVEIPKEGLGKKQEDEPETKDLSDAETLPGKEPDAEEQAQNEPVPTTHLKPALTTATTPISPQVLFDLSAEIPEPTEKFDELHVPEFYEESAGGAPSELKAAHPERERIDDREFLEGCGLKIELDDSLQKYIIPIESTDPDSTIPDTLLTKAVRRMTVDEERIDLAKILFKHNYQKILSLEMEVYWTHGTLDRGNPLHYAVISNNIEMVALLIKYGVKMNTVTKEGYTVLHIAAAEKNVGLKMLDLLIANGAPLTGHMAQWNRSQLSILHIATLAVAGNNEGLAKLNLLLKSGVEIDVANAFGVTPLMTSINHSRAETTMALLEAGANVNAVSSAGDTSLHLAARYYNGLRHERRDDGRLKIGWLVAYKADRNVKDKKGKRPVDYVKDPVALKMLAGKLKPDPWYRF